jgi:hypothetical protein
MKWPFTPIAAVALMLGGSLVPGAVAHADPAPPAPPAPPASSITKDGQYQVGKDLAPGNYASAGPVADGTCSWRRADASGTTVDSAISKKAQVVTIAPTDATFKTRGCQNWSLTDQAPPAPVGNLQAQILLGTLGSLAGGMGGPRPAAPAPGDAAPAPSASAPSP